MLPGEFETKANFVNCQIEKDIKTISKTDLIKHFDDLLKFKNNPNFIKFYNRTVLNKEKINFGEFKKQWAIQGMTREVYKWFDDNYCKLKQEIEKEKDIKKFFKAHCCTVRKEASFCSKLFHTILPMEFPPVDNPVKKLFRLRKEEFIDSVLIIQRGYLLFIKENKDWIYSIRELLSTPSFSVLRIKELSDIRIIDMYYWYQGQKEEEEKKARKSPGPESGITYQA